MANGQPRPAFYVAVLLVVLGLVGLALWRYGAIGPKAADGQLHRRRAEADEERAPRRPTAPASRRSRNTTTSPPSRLPEVKGISSYKPMADRTVRFAINVWAGWGPIIYANNGFKPGKVWKTPGGKDFKVELVLIDDPIAMRDAYAAGNLHVGWATLDMLPLFLEGLRKDSRVMPRVYQQVDWSNGGDGIVVRDTDQDDGGSARQDDRAGAELAVALLRAERADQRRRAAGGGRVQVHAGRVPGGGRVQRRQAPRRRA